RAHAELRQMKTTSMIVALALLAPLAGTARAQVAPPPAEIPNLPDVPLPEWKPSPRLASSTLVLGVSRELRQPEALRRVGLVLASLGLASLLAGGITDAQAVQLDTQLKSPRDGLYHPDVADQRDRVTYAAVSLLTIGSAFTLAGFTTYAVGQVRIN